MSELISGKVIKIQAWIKFSQKNANQKINPQNYLTLTQQEKTMQFSSPIKKNSNYISSLFQNPLNTTNKLIMHSFIKYKSFSFSFTHIFRQNIQTLQISQKLSNTIYQNLYIKCLPCFCSMAIGGYQSGIGQLIQGTTSNQGLYYSSIIKLIQKIRKNVSKNQKEEFINFKMNFIFVLENNAIDLLNIQKKIVLVQNGDAHQKFDYYILHPLIFEGATSYEFLTPYDLYTTLKKVFQKKRQIKDWGVLAIQILIEQEVENTLNTNKNILLLEWEKTPKNQVIYSKMFQSQKPLLCLNQCILELYKLRQKNTTQKTFSQKQNQQAENKQIVYKRKEINELKNLQCFRNSTITRILKPYLLFNSKIVILGCCSLDQKLQNDSYQTLMFCKHISKLTSFSKIQHNGKGEQIISSIHNKLQKRITNLDNSQKQQNFRIKDQISVNNRNKSERIVVKIQDPIYTNQIDQSQKKQNNQQTNRIKKSQKRSQTPKFSEIKDPLIIKQKMRKMLKQINEKSQSEQEKLTEMIKKQHQYKTKILLIKKQKAIIQAKKKQYNLKHLINNSLPFINIKNKGYQLIQQQKLERDQQNKLCKQEEQILVQLTKLTKQIYNKLHQFEQKQNESQIASTYVKNKKALQNIKLIKTKLKNQLQLIQQQTDQFLQEKHQIKKVYQNQLINIREQQNQLMKKITRKTQPIVQIYDQLSESEYKSLQVSKEKKKKPKYKPLRLIKEMEPYFSPHRQILDRKLKLNEENLKTIEYKTIQPKRLIQLKKSVQNDYKGEIKLSRSLLKRKEILKQKIKKGRVKENSFFDQISVKYELYGEEKMKSQK